MILSHSNPNKELSIHVKGVYDKARFRKESELLMFVCLYHDLGKINPNFQKKLFHYTNGYTKHSLLSLFLLFYLNENKYLKLNSKELNIISNIIVSHHGNLRNINDIFKSNDDGVYQEIEELYNFLKYSIIDIKKYFNDFDEKISISDFKEYIFNMFKKIQSNHFIERWKDDSLESYYKTLFTFSQLIEADKRDASDNNDYILSDIKIFNKIFDNNLNKFLSNLKINNKLNEIRTEIRLESNQNLENILNNSDNRLFSLTSPTGSGKTFMLLKLANTIQKVKGDYSILFSIPFTSIIEQTSSIIENDLLIDVLNRTSVANNSKSIEKYQKDLENGYCDEKLEDLLKCKFSEDTFDNPFILTTFVQLFETLISNRNSSLLKLPNFSKRIFLIDEIQSLPSDLYTFFYALLQHFCKKYDSYAILSTATMPNFELNSKIDDNEFKLSKLFSDFEKPIQLLDYKKYYNNDVFNRYIINNNGENDLLELVSDIEKFDTCLIIMNTVPDSLEVFDNLTSDNKFLLNNKFTPESKIKIIENIKYRLKNNLPTILVATSLIEAGVDIDFPIVFRDLAPIANIIQSAGRNNREGKMEKFGNFYLFKYFKINEKNKKIFSCDYIHSLYDTKFVFSNIVESIYEKDLLLLQEKYYKEISTWKSIGKCKIKDKDENLSKLIYNGQIEKIGEFRLIPNSDDEYPHYIGDDSLWQEYVNVVDNKPNSNNFKIFKEWSINLEIITKKIRKYTININIVKNPLITQDLILGIYKIDKSYYSEIRGLNNIDDNFI